jgi:hypothetical protein
MNITHKEICDLYRAYLNEKIPLSRKQCLSIVDIMKFFYPRTRKGIKTKIVDHISRCALCAQEFELLLEIKRGTDSLSEDIGSWLESKPVSSKPRRSFMRRFFILQVIRNYAVVFVGIIFLCTSLLLLFQKGPIALFRIPMERESRLPGIHLIEPLHGRVSRTHLVFKWDENKFVDHYVLEIFDEALLPVWRSPQLFENLCSIPSEMTKKLPSFKTYLWMVTGYTKTGNAIESPLVGFTLVD